jgi:hypothetical protein
MTLMRIATVLPMFTNIPEDIVMNTIHVEVATQDKFQTAANCEVFMKAFYEDAYGAGATNRVNYCDWLNMKCRVFDLSEPSPRVPAESLPLFTVQGTAASSIPTEVAVVASFESNGLPGEVYQRKYNRIYLGALANGFMNASASTSFPIVSPAFVAQVNTAMTNLQIALPGPEIIWVQVSNATGTPRTLPVIGGWCDNAPDTQRRRSVDATIRSPWVV